MDGMCKDCIRRKNCSLAKMTQTAIMIGCSDCEEEYDADREESYRRARNKLINQMERRRNEPLR